MRHSSRSLVTVVASLSVVAALIAPTAAIGASRPAVSNSDQARTERYFQSIRNNPNLLLAFLQEMPKGGDLHNHLVGRDLRGVAHPVGCGQPGLRRSKDLHDQRRSRAVPPSRSAMPSVIPACMLR